MTIQLCYDMIKFNMDFPHSTQREGQYGIAGTILAETGLDIGIKLEPHMSEQWAKTMARLSLADDLSETNPDTLTDPKVLVKALGIDSPSAELVAAANGLLNANKLSSNALNVKNHFMGRGLEAWCSLGLLRYQSQAAHSNTHSWDQLGFLCEAGIYLDSVFDAKADSTRLRQFSALQLGVGALAHFIGTVSYIKPSTFIAFERAAHRQGLNKHLVTKPLRVLSSKVNMAS